VELSDEQVINLAAVKKAEYQRDQSTQQLVEKAVRIISDQRNSDYLRTWLATGDAPLVSDEDELTAAYNFYDIKDRSCSLDEGVLGSLRLLKESEDKGEGKAEMAEKYYELLLRHIRGQTGATVADYSTPVGLQNMGNTCYLNSLLQYFYAIKPFRDIVSNFDLHKQPLGPNTPDQLGRVGGNVVTRGDVKDGQECKSKCNI
jgi:ubiquitin carboxyl-terminal hydrolase 25/28